MEKGAEVMAKASLLTVCIYQYEFRNIQLAMAVSAEVDNTFYSNLSDEYIYI